MTVAISYIRFSTPEQAEGDSLRRQTESTEKWRERNGVTLDTSHTLKDLGKSAYTKRKRTAPPDDGMASLPELEEIVNPDRKALAAFLALNEKRKIPRGAFFVIENLDRLSRDEAVPACHLLTTILMSGVKVVQLKPVEQVLTEKSDAFEVMRAVMELSRGNCAPAGRATPPARCRRCLRTARRCTWRSPAPRSVRAPTPCSS
jgi:DNA invertase Pin-like site-specific DNA recombinase